LDGGIKEQRRGGPGGDRITTINPGRGLFDEGDGRPSWRLGVDKLGDPPAQQGPERADHEKQKRLGE
jgi:hypothetical protein